MSQEVDPVQRRRLEPLDNRAGIGEGEMRMDVGERRAGLAVTEQPHGPDRRMPGAEP